MNLAQCIAPEFAQGRCQPHHAPSRPAGFVFDGATRKHLIRDDDAPALPGGLPAAQPPKLPPPGKPARGGVYVTVLRALKAYGLFGALSEVLAGDTDLAVVVVTQAIGNLVQAGRVEKASAQRPFRWRVTEKGRKYLEDFG